MALNESEFIDNIIRFLGGCCTATGRHENRIPARNLWQAFDAWAFENRVPPIQERKFYLGMKSAIGVWKCQRTGHRIGRVKCSIWYYTGITIPEALTADTPPAPT